MREKWLLAGVLLAAIPAAEAAKSSENESLRDKNGEPVQAGVFTSRWGRLFSGNDKKFSGALSFSSGLKEQWMSIPNSSDTATEKKKINQTLNLSLQYSPQLLVCQHYVPTAGQRHQPLHRRFSLQLRLR